MGSLAFFLLKYSLLKSTKPFSTFPSFLSFFIIWIYLCSSCQSDLWLEPSRSLRNFIHIYPWTRRPGGRLTGLRRKEAKAYVYTRIVPIYSSQPTPGWLHLFVRSAIANQTHVKGLPYPPSCHQDENGPVIVVFIPPFPASFARFQLNLFA